MIRILKAIFGVLPKDIRHALVRRGLRIQPIHESEIRFKIATTKSELESAFRLLHDCYVKAGLMEPHPSGLRCTFFSALPVCSTIVAKVGDEVIGTVSLIRDSEAGFPSDSEYKKENDRFRSKGYRMVEVSALAVAPAYRGDHRISLHLMKYLGMYASQYMDCNMLCATIHPRVADFYSGLMGFRQNGKVVKYGFVKGALAAHISLDCDNSYRDALPRLYEGAPPERDLYSFMVDPDAPFDFPSRNTGCSLDPVMNPELLNYFYVEKTDLLRNLSTEKLALIYRAYELNFDLSQVPGLNSLISEGKEEQVKAARGYRFPMQMDLMVSSKTGGGGPTIARIENLSTGGVRIETAVPLALGDSVQLRFIIGGVEFKIPSEVRWGRPVSNVRSRFSYGIRFRVSDLRLVKLLKSIHHNNDVRVGVYG